MNRKIGGFAEYQGCKLRSKQHEMKAPLLHNQARSSYFRFVNVKACGFRGARSNDRRRSPSQRVLLYPDSTSMTQLPEIRNQ